MRKKRKEGPGGLAHTVVMATANGEKVMNVDNNHSFGGWAGLNGGENSPDPFALAAMTHPVSCAGARSKARATDPWRALRDYGPDCVVCCPSGDSVAFVATDGRPVERASIWIWSLPKPGHVSRLRRLAVRSYRQGIPVGLFRCFGNLFPKRTGATLSKDSRQVRLI